MCVPITTCTGLTLVPVILSLPEVLASTANTWLPMLLVTPSACKSLEITLRRIRCLNNLCKVDLRYTVSEGPTYYLNNLCKVDLRHTMSEGPIYYLNNLYKVNIRHTVSEDPIYCLIIFK